jgi:hypothetical protein
MDDDEKEMWKAMSGKHTGTDVLDDSDSDTDVKAKRSKSKQQHDDEQDDDATEEDGMFILSQGVKGNQLFGGLSQDKESSVVAVTLKFPASVRSHCLHASYCIHTIVP